MITFHLTKLFLSKKDGENFLKIAKSLNEPPILFLIVKYELQQDAFLNFCLN